MSDTAKCSDSVSWISLPHSLCIYFVDSQMNDVTPGHDALNGDQSVGGKKRA